MKRGMSSYRQGCGWMCIPCLDSRALPTSLYAATVTVERSEHSPLAQPRYRSSRRMLFNSSLERIIGEF